LSEIMNGGSGGIADSAGATADWLEVTNTSSTQAVNLNGWQLQYGNGPTTWTFPAVTLGPAESRVIFCDSVPATDPVQELHTNFNLSKSGKNLVLLDNDNNTISSYTPYPALSSNVSYGVGEAVSETDLVAAGATATYLAPTDNSLGTTWTQPGFNDGAGSGWASGPTGLGFAAVPGFAATLYRANTGSVSTLNQAEAVISTSSEQSSATGKTESVLNFMDTGGGGHFGNDNPFPGMTVGEGLQYYVLQATGTIQVTAKQAGYYTFGVNSDDGFTLTIGTGTTGTSPNFSNPVNTTACSGGTMTCDRLQGPTDTLATTYLAAGSYPVNLVYFQNQGGASLEFYAAKESSPGVTTFDAANSYLVGDAADGGLAVSSVPFVGQSSTASPLSSAIGTNVSAAVQNAIATAGSTSLYSRITFGAANLASLTSLTLRMQYDSGYVAYLNGVEIASRNAPSSPTWNSPALEYRNSPVQATTYEDVDISSFLNPATTGHLAATGNVLAIQTLMKTPTDQDLFVMPEISQIAITQEGLHFFAVPTPGTYNTPSTWQPDLTFSAQHGFYSTPFLLTLSTTTPGATIYYTTNSSTPSATNGTAYTGPITISTTTIVRAVSVVAGGQAGIVSTESYIFPAAVINQPAAPSGFPTVWGEDTGGNPLPANYAMNTQITQSPLYSAGLQQDLLSIPTVSISTAVSNMFDATQSQTTNTGIYTNETNLVQGSINGVPLQMTAPASFEYFNSSGTISVQANMGLQMEGGVGRYPQFDKHSFRMSFSSDYGPSTLNYPLFPGDLITSFKNVDLKAGFNDAFSWCGSGSPGTTGGDAAEYMRDIFGANNMLAMGQPAFHSNYVFLYIDGLFWGVYMMMERPDAYFAASYMGGTASDWEANNAGHEVDGSATNLPYWNALQNLPTSSSFATNSLAFYEQAQGNNANGTPNSSYTDLLDVPNYIDYMLMNFYIGNTDWPWHNFYAAIDTADPTGFKFFNWDAEMSLGLVNGGFNSNVAVNVLGPSFSGGNGVGTMYSALYSNPEFDMAFADQARQFLFDNGALTPTAAIARLQAQINTIQQAMVGESARWGNIATSPGPIPNTQAAWLNTANWLTGTYLPQRTAIFLAQLQAAGLYPTITAPEFYVNGSDEYGGTFNPGNSLTMPTTGLPAGAVIYYTLDGSDPRLLGGAVNTAADVFQYSGPITLTQGEEVRARVYSGGTWSAISEAEFTVNLQSLRVTEVMYDPAPATPAEAAGYTSVDGNEDFEFLEIENIGTQTLPLGGLQIGGGVTFTFPQYEGNVSTNPLLTLAPNNYIVVVSDLSAFAIRYGAELQAQFGSNWQNLVVAGQYTHHLGNSGDEIQLTAPNGGVIQDFTYDGGWYPQTHGDGFSLTVRSSTQALALWDSSAGWEASGAPNGTPGTAETTATPLPGSVVINEVLANPATAGGDMVELYNTTSQPVNVGSWWLSDSSTNLTMYQIAANTSIAAGGYLVLTDAKNYGPGSGDSGAKTPFTLSKYGFTVCLSSNAGGVAGGYQVEEDYGASPPGISVGLLTTSTGATDFVLLSAPTFGQPVGGVYPGAVNSLAYVSPVVMSELQYDPAQPTAAETAAGYTDGDDFEFLELYNRSATTQTLSNYYVGHGVGFTFGWYPDGTVNESWTLESGATAAWTTSALAAGTYTVYADYSLTDPDNNTRTVDSAAQYA
ncbi:MAG: lamin tail domain-containing protein, partial [Thermoguttaceae bacterium]